MRKAVLITMQLLMKGVIFLALAIVWILYHLSMICCMTVRFIALPLMLVSGVIAVTTYPDAGLSRDVLDCVLVFASAAVFYFALPYASVLLNYAVVFLTGMLKSPFHVDTPVKYTF